MYPSVSLWALPRPVVVLHCESACLSRGPRLMCGRASIVTPAPLLPRKKGLLFETAFKAGQDRLRVTEAMGMDLDQ